MSEEASEYKKMNELLERALRGAIITGGEVVDGFPSIDKIVITTLNGYRVTIESSEWISGVKVEASDGRGGWQ